MPFCNLPVDSGFQIVWKLNLHDDTHEPLHAKQSTKISECVQQ
jgi:hypothetical protein